MGSRMKCLYVKSGTSDSHSEDWGSNPHGGAINVIRRDFFHPHCHCKVAKVNRSNLKKDAPINGD